MLSFTGQDRTAPVSKLPGAFGAGIPGAGAPHGTQSFILVLLTFHFFLITFLKFFLSDEHMSSKLHLGT